MIPQLSRIAAVLKGAFGFVTANRDPVTGGITKIAKLTQAQYDALAVKDPDTLYVIVAG